MQQYQYSTNPDPFGYSSRVFPDLTTTPPPQQPPWNYPQDPFLSSSYAGLFTRRPSNYNNNSLQFAYDGVSDQHLRFFSDAGNPFGLQEEINKLTAQEIMDAKALAASKSHSEAERRRRERINNHLAKLRSLLPSTTKTDKASLLAEVIQHVKELRRQTSIISETSVVPTETDELTVDASSDGEDGRLVIKASLCCDDRNDLLPDLIKALKSLRLRTLKAEITTLGGRVKNVLYITHDHPMYSDGCDNDDNDDDDNELAFRGSIGCIEEALREVMEKSKGGDECNTTLSGNAKRQRTATINLT